jgi:hypothetical protein
MVRILVGAFEKAGAVEQAEFWKAKLVSAREDPSLPE